MNKWIPVTEQLPKVNEYGYSDSVLVTIRIGDDADNDAYNFVYIANWCEVGYMRFWRIDEEYAEDIIAWMPLPKPWRGEANNVQRRYEALPVLRWETRVDTSWSIQE